MDRMFDFDELAVQSLDQRWPKLSKNERTEFVKLFRQLVQNTYIEKTEKIFSNLNLIFERENGDSKKSIVYCTSKQKDADVSIEYHLHFKKQGWKIIDIIIDGSSLIRNYRSQFNRFLQDKSFKALLDTMRNKVTSGV